MFLPDRLLYRTVVSQGKTSSPKLHRQQEIPAGKCLAIQDASLRERQIPVAADARSRNFPIFPKLKRLDRQG
jgi:hypothetical protein